MVRFQGPVWGQIELAQEQAEQAQLCSYLALIYFLPFVLCFYQYYRPPC